MIHTWTLKRCIDCAKNLTEKAANVKDWRIRNKYDREMREIARDLNGKRGYLLATVDELKAKYPGKITVGKCEEDASRKILWGITYNAYVWAGNHHFSFVPIR